MGVPVMRGRAEHSKEQRRDAYRRLFDVVMSSLLLLIVLPVMLLTIAGSVLSLRAWPLFVQERIGRNGEPFRFIKVRTLPTSVPAYTDKHQLAGARVPRFCQLMRRLHLDELPQLILVLRGHMSLVGPRPEMAYLHEQMPWSFASKRTAVRPGCTGLWQVSESCTDLIAVSPEYDDFYLTHRSLRLDLWVLARTAGKMLGLARPVTLDDVPAWVSGSVESTVVLDLTETSGSDRSRQLASAG